MKIKALFFFCLLSMAAIPAKSQAITEKDSVLNVIHEFFSALEKQDSITFRNLHLKDARFYILQDNDTAVRTAIRDVSQFPFRKGQVIKERMRDNHVTVQIHDRIATVWAPYDLWLNNVFSHCGIDVFTLFKTSDGWKIANCSYTMETTGCGNVPVPK